MQEAGGGRCGRLSPGRAGRRGGTRLRPEHRRGVVRRGPRPPPPRAAEGRRPGARPRARSSCPPGLGRTRLPGGLRRAIALPRGRGGAGCVLLPVSSGSRGRGDGDAGGRCRLCSAQPACAKRLREPHLRGWARTQLGKGMPFLSPARTPPPPPHVSALPGPSPPGSCPPSCCPLRPALQMRGDGFPGPSFCSAPAKGQGGRRAGERSLGSFQPPAPAQVASLCRCWGGGGVTAPPHASRDQEGQLLCSGHAPSALATSPLSLPFQPSPPPAVSACESPSVFPGIGKPGVKHSHH